MRQSIGLYTIMRSDYPYVANNNRHRNVEAKAVLTSLGYDTFLVDCKRFTFQILHRSACACVVSRLSEHGEYFTYTLPYRFKLELSHWRSVLLRPLIVVPQVSSVMKVTLRTPWNVCQSPYTRIRA